MRGLTLQNIPIRTETGRAIRAAFQPIEPLANADYAALETRILAQRDPGEGAYGTGVAAVSSKRET